MKKFILPLLLLLATFVTAQKKLITPIVEAPPMNKSQAKAFKTFSDFNNWGIKKTGLDSIIKQGYTGKGIKVCICDTGKPQHFALRGRVASWKDFTTDNNPNDGHGLSTHVAGIVNEIAPEAQLYFAKVLATDDWGTDRGIADGDMVAPGANILSLWLDNKYIPPSGTSMARPFVAGASALYIEKYGRMTLAEHKIKMAYKDIIPIGYEETFFGHIEPKAMFQPEPPKEEEAQEPQNPETPNTEQPDTLLDNPIDSIIAIDTTDVGTGKDSTDTNLTPIQDGDTFADMTPEQIKWVLIAMGVLLAIGLIWRFFKLKSR